jgi:hypothetical protein
MAGQAGTPQPKGRIGAHLGKGQQPSATGQFNRPPQGSPLQHYPPLPMLNLHMLQHDPRNPGNPRNPRGRENMGNGMRNKGPPAGFAPNFNPRVAQYVNDLSSDHDDLESAYHSDVELESTYDRWSDSARTLRLEPDTSFSTSFSLNGTAMSHTVLSYDSND